MWFNWKRWLRLVKSGAFRKVQPIRRKFISRFRPALVELEDRLAPATLLVNSTLDNTALDSVLTLREAILLVDFAGDDLAALGRKTTPEEKAQFAGAFGISDTIQFDASLNGQTITLSGELLIAKDLAINGPGANKLKVSGGKSSRVFEIASATTVSIDGVTISDGHGGLGGGILSDGKLSISNSTITANVADDSGGGIYSRSGGLTISASTLSKNQSHLDGGGIYSEVSLTLTNSSLDGNFADRHGGGAFTKVGGSVVNGDFFGNTSGLLISGGSGGGIYVENGGLSVSDSRISGNAALTGDGGGIYLDKSLLRFTSTTLDANRANRGGGIFNHAGGLNAGNTTLAGNFAGEGGGLFNESLVNVTVSGVSFNGATLEACTVALNVGGGIRSAQGSMTLRNSLIAGNTKSPTPDIFGNITTDLGHNLIGNTTGTGGLTFPNMLTDVLNVDPLLAPLGNFFNQTHTVALLPGSPAIDAGDNANAPATDQRGRPRIVNGTIDIGAFESSGFTINITGGDNQQTAVDRPFLTPLSVRVVSDANEPVVGGVVTFDAPGSGAGASFPSGNTTTLTSESKAFDFIGLGNVSARANGIAGSYTVSAAARGASPVEFHLTNVDPNVFIVTNTDDSGPGSLRQAILDANATENVFVDVPDEIHFDIDGTNVHTITPQSQLPFITDPVYIDGYTQPGASANTHAMTDPDPSDNAVPLIEISGATLLTNGIGLVLLDPADGSTIRGLVIDQGFSRGIVVQASDVHIEGCFIGVDPTGTTAHGNGIGVFFDSGVDTSNGVVGGTTPDKRNVISGNNPDIFIQSGTKHLIQGNLIGTDATGLVSLSAGTGVGIQGSSDNLIGGSTPAERNVIISSGTAVRVDAGAGNQIQGNFVQILIDGATRGNSTGIGITLDNAAPNTLVGGLTSTPGTGAGNVIAGQFGILISIGAHDNVIQGNLIGTDATGTKAVGIANEGILVTGDHNTIGGSSTDARNVISACGLRGISLTTISTGSSHDNLIQNNFIGTDINGNVNSLGNGEGVFLSVSSDNQILDNVIAGNSARGINVSGAVTNTAILGNSIFANGNLGIDLVGGKQDAFGVTENDPGDLDSGSAAPNNLQNYPEITSVTSTGVSTTISGTFNSAPNTTFRIEFFASDDADASGFGEGQTFLGFFDVTTDANGDAVDGNGNPGFTANLPVGVTAAQVVTATATDPNGNTSEFSAVHAVEVIVNADLAVTQTDSPDPVTLGDVVTYQITVANNGPNTATGVTLLDTLSNNIDLFSVTSDHSFVQQGVLLRFFLDNLDAGASTTVNVTVHPLAVGGMSNFVSVQANELDPNFNNNSDTEFTTVNPATTADVFVTQTDSLDPAFVGDNVTYLITVANNGPANATGVTLVDTLPTGVTLVSADHSFVQNNGKLTFSLGDLAPAASVKIGIVVRPTIAGTINNLASVSANEADSNTANNSDTESTAVGDGPLTFVVTNTLDSGPGSLRQAILDANAHIGKDTIGFSIGKGAQSIFVGVDQLTELPNIIDPVVIDGTTQPGFAGKPLIEVSGSKLGGFATGLTIASGNSTVKSLAINSFAIDGIRLLGGGNLIAGSYIGTDLSGTVAKGNGFFGVEIVAGANDIIGGTTAGARNLISGNGSIGVLLDQSASNTLIAGNFIGTDFIGTHALPNLTGIEVHSTSATIGGVKLAARNLISGNSGEGVLLFSSATVLGNFIGTDVSGTKALGNSIGVVVDGPGATIGGTALGARNIISGNQSFGISITSDSATVQGNFIGADVLGTHALGNLASGIVVNGGSNNLIGGATQTARNLISGNKADGIQFFALDDTLPTGNRVQGNFIGPDVTGGRVLGNQHFGVAVFAGEQNTVGGTTLGARNIISGNLASGVLIQGASASGNAVQGNLIGLAVSTRTKLANLNGIDIDQGAVGNTIGGTVAGARNIISGNTADGVLIHNGATTNLVAGNFIGTNLVGAAALANVNGVEIDAPQNTVGGTTAGAANVISGNLSIGVLVTAQATGNVVEGNRIGTTAAGSRLLANTIGVRVLGVGNTVGGAVAGAGNVISGNLLAGVDLRAGAAQNVVQGNLLGLDATGKAAIGNGNGIFIDGAANNTIGGTAAAARNVISGNRDDGVLLAEGAASNQVLGNFIGTDVTGTARLANALIGVHLLDSVENIIGGAAPGAGNVISGNTLDGVKILAGSDNQVLGNLIGTNAAGAKSLPNGILSNGQLTGNGVTLNDTFDNVIGGSVPGAGNVISGNANHGVFISSGSANQVLGNFIGTDISGALAIANGTILGGTRLGSGVEVNNSRFNVVGGTDPLSRNVISGNTASGIHLTGTRATNTVVQGNSIGADASGTAALSNGIAGVLIDGKAQNNNIGQTTPGAGNLISGNTSVPGVLIRDVAASENVVSGNFIGTDIFGGHSLANAVGVSIVNTTENVIARNVISGNTENGVLIQGVAGALANNNLVQGNFIGTDASGTQAVANGAEGVFVNTNANSNTIGGTSLGAGNVISGNKKAGIKFGSGASGNKAQGNFVGTDAGGTFAVPNGGSGVLVLLAKGTIVGGSEPGAANVISGNAGDGVNISATSTQVQGNLIGTDVTGSFAVPNANHGVEITSGGTTIGGADGDAGNVISGNARDGVFITSAAARNNQVRGNFIGTDASGTFAVANQANGVEIAAGANNNSIGGAHFEDGNVISGNVGAGVLLTGTLSTANKISANLIGTDASGTVAVGNGLGVDVVSANGNTIGGAADGVINVISGNTQGGVRITTSNDTKVLGNFIGTDFSGTAVVANGGSGIFVTAGLRTTIGGLTVDASNLISGNAGDGVRIAGDSKTTNSQSNVIQGNFIGTDVSGTLPLGNTGNGLFITGRGNGNIIGNPAGAAVAGAANFIAFNGLAGIVVNSGLRNRISRNSMFSNGGLGVVLNNLANGNNSQNAPQLFSAKLNADGTVTVSGKLDKSTPNTTFIAEFFISPAGDPEAMTYFDTKTITTNDLGFRSFTFRFTVAASVGDLISVTVTDSIGNTSQISVALAVS